MAAALTCARSSCRMLINKQSSLSAGRLALYSTFIRSTPQRCCARGRLRLLYAVGANVPLQQSVKRWCFHPGASKAVPMGDLGGRQPDTRMILVRLWQYVWPPGNGKVKRRVLLAVALLVGAKLIGITVPFFMKGAVDFYNERVPANGKKLELGEDAADSIFTAGVTLILAYGLARATAAAFSEARNAVFAYVAQNSMRKIGQNVFIHLHNLDLNFHLNRQTGALAKAIDRGSRGINAVLSQLVLSVVPTIFEVGVVSGVMWFKCGPAFAGATIAATVCYGTYTLLITRWRTRFRVEMNQADNEAGNRAVDSLINYETVKYFNNERFEVNQYDKYLARYEHASLKTQTSLALLNGGQNAITSASLAALMFMTAQQIQQGNMTVGDLVMVNGLFFQLTIPLSFLGSLYRELRQSVIDMQNMFKLLSIEAEIKDPVRAAPLDVTSTGTAIEFDRVTFGYVPGRPILDSLSFRVPVGKKVAIVGGSGSGKSTLVRLLFRFYDIHDGAILLGGQPIDALALQSVRSSIGVVPQDCVLFHDSLYYNIAYGRPDATPEQVYAAAKMAGLHDAVLGMPHGYDTRVGERGLKLSGGEKQRVAIARTILKDPPIIVYDEATSNLDANTEQTIMEALKKSVGHRTSLFIAHRLATISDADEILVLEKGHIVERGNHDQLISTPGSRYGQLWRLQNQYEKQSIKQPTRPAKTDKQAEMDALLANMSNTACCGGSCNK